MKKILIAILLSVSAFAYAGMDRQGNPMLDPEAPPRAQSVQANEPAEDGAKGIDLLGEVLRHINRSYYKEINWATCIPALLKSGVSGCTDRYSFYLDPVQASEERDIFMDGKLAGIGATMELNKEGGAKILDVTEGSPAEKAGLQAGDVVIAVSSNTENPSATWTDLEGMPLDQTVKLIRGPKGTKINLLVIRDGVQKKFLVTRDDIRLKFLKSKMIGEKIGYIKIKSFAGEVSDEFF